ncbi:hypothetical protein ACHAWF_008742 [Thalassiosira exigua]
MSNASRRRPSSTTAAPTPTKRSVDGVDRSPAVARRRSRRRRPARILAFAVLFVLVALRRLYWDVERSGAAFLAGLLDVSPSPPPPLSSSPGRHGRRYGSARGVDLIAFYNLYVPRNGTLGAADEGDVANAISVVEDQMGQVAAALRKMEGEGKEREKAGGSGTSRIERKGVVLYNLLGEGEAFPPSEMEILCRKLHPRLECRLLEHREEGSEAVTLQDVHDFCSGLDDGGGNGTDVRVAYLHSKGSYHPLPTNHIWRRIMTDAALHPDCLRPPDDRCDVCGAQFYIKYAIMFPGNMWTAKCSYIKTLIPPNTGEYERRKRDSVKHFLFLRLWGALQAILDKDSVEHYGLDRYMWEHWVASRPQVRPCEVHTTDVGPLILLGKDPQGRPFGPEYYDFGMAPRRISHNLGGLRGPRMRLEKRPDLQLREYYYLPGNLLRWIHLYGREGVPDEDSWAWRDFPAGDRWREWTREHGEGAVDAMVRASRPRFHSAFAGNATSIAFEDGSSSGSDPLRATFYQIEFPPGEEKKALGVVKSQFDAFSMGRYDDATSAFDRTQKLSLYYAVAGGGARELDAVAKLCEDKSHALECRRLGAYDEEASGESLRHLHAYCRAHPTRDATYLSNRLPGYERGGFDAAKLGEIATAMTSKLCLPPGGSARGASGDAGRCNVCGTEFYPLPFPHFVGNAFSASCSHVRDLLPPPEFEAQMNDVAGDALLSEMEGRHAARLAQFTPRNLGSYQHAVEHWAGSHPDLRPCDVAPLPSAEEVKETTSEGRTTRGFEEKMLDRMKTYSRGSAPRREGAPHGLLADEGEVHFRKNKRGLALREWYYLAGNVARWLGLYGKVPADDGWAWQWYPDENAWRSAARSAGEGALEELARHWATGASG